MHNAFCRYISYSAFILFIVQLLLSFGRIVIFWKICLKLDFFLLENYEAWYQGFISMCFLVFLVRLTGAVPTFHWKKCIFYMAIVFLTYWHMEEITQIVEILVSGLLSWLKVFLCFISIILRAIWYSSADDGAALDEVIGRCWISN